jgi:hypothetical protein
MATVDYGTINGIIATCEAYGLAVPAKLRAADKAQVELVEAIEAELRGIRGEATANAASVGSIADLHRELEMITRQETRAARESFCRQAMKSAQAARPALWFPFLCDLLDLLRGPFDDLGAQLTEAARKMPGVSPQVAVDGHGEAHATVRDCAGRLSNLRLLRTTLARFVDPNLHVPDSCPAASDIAHGPDLHSYSRAATRGLAVDTAPWWFALARTPEIRIEWHTPAEQIERYANLPQRAETAAAAG